MRSSPVAEARGTPIHQIRSSCGQLVISHRRAAAKTEANDRLVWLEGNEASACESGAANVSLKWTYGRSRAKRRLGIPVAAASTAKTQAMVLIAPALWVRGQSSA